MSERNDDVLALVRELIGKYPTVNSTQLYDKAVRVHPFLDGDGLRAFHARYVLPIRRAQAVAEGRPRKPRQPKVKTQAPAVHSTDSGGNARAVRSSRAAANDIDRDRIRNVLLRFARDFSAAESRVEIVDMLARIDDFVEDIVAPPAAAPADDET